MGGKERIDAPALLAAFAGIEAPSPAKASEALSVPEYFLPVVTSLTSHQVFLSGLDF